MSYLLIGVVVGIIIATILFVTLLYLMADKESDKYYIVEKPYKEK